MSERAIPDMLRERLTTAERALWQRVQLVIDGDNTHVDVEAAVLDGLFDKVAHMRRRELEHEADLEQLRASKAELLQQAEAAADIIVGLAKLLSAARATAKEAQG